MALFRQKNEGGGFYWRGASIRENTVDIVFVWIKYALFKFVDVIQRVK